MRAADADRFVAVRERCRARGACETQVIDFGEHASVLATDHDPWWRCSWRSTSVTVCRSPLEPHT
jgi:hypothetical protein